MPIPNNNRSATLHSSYLEYLPGVFRDDELMGSFLLIFESILKPVESTVDNIASYFNPLITPEPLLPWLASWLDLSLDQTWPEERRRELVKLAAELYRWRGTKRGLTEYLRIYSGSIPEISEYTPGMQLDSDAKLGINTQLGSAGSGHHFTVTLAVDEKNEIDVSKVRAIIEAEKPAHTAYTLQIIHSSKG